MSKFVYFFGKDVTDGKSSMKALLGGKGANLAEMANLGIPVSPGFTITTEACVFYFKNHTYSDEIGKQINKAINKLETLNNKKLGDPENPLIISVMSGARVSMPGMDTVLNLGLTDKSVIGLANMVEDVRFAYDCYRRSISMFGNVVLGIDFKKFECLTEDMKKELKVESDTDLDAKALKELVERFKEVIKLETGLEFPQDPKIQLQMAIESIFESWNSPRAITYRKLNGIDDSGGTAINIQTVDYENRGNTSGIGIAFGRKQPIGYERFFGEKLIHETSGNPLYERRKVLVEGNLISKIRCKYAILKDLWKSVEWWIFINGPWIYVQGILDRFRYSTAL